MTTASGVAVVATQLARTDRRALSQAWYSALHLAQTTPAARDAHFAAPATARASAAPRGSAPIHEVPPAPRTAARPLPARSTTAVPADRRAAPTEAARRLERAVAALARRPAPRPSHTVAIDGGRVTLLVRSDRGATRVVALCREPLRATVERALARARFSLAARGMTVDAR
jgi:hypothetical protein